jgi:hypothetical protein
MSTSGQLVGISEITAVRQFRLGVDRTLGCTVYDFVAVRASKTPQINNCLLSGNLASRSMEGLGSESHALFFSSALRLGRVGIEARAKPFLRPICSCSANIGLFLEADFLPGMTSALPMKLPNPGFWSR